MDFHLAITTLLNNFTNTIERAISSLHTRTARERKQTRNNLLSRSRAHHRPRKKINLCRLACIVHVTVCATQVAANPTTSRAVFDTDSIPIRVDNCATASISNDLKDFQGPLTPARGRIKGITGYTHNSGMKRGTIVWNIEDDQGQVHHIKLPGSYYVPDSTSRILSPQRWSQQARDHFAADIDIDLTSSVPPGLGSISDESIVIETWSKPPGLASRASSSINDGIGTAPGEQYKKIRRLGTHGLGTIPDESIVIETWSERPSLVCLFRLSLILTTMEWMSLRASLLDSA